MATVKGGELLTAPRPGTLRFPLELLLNGRPFLVVAGVGDIHQVEDLTAPRDLDAEAKRNSATNGQCCRTTAI